MMKIVPDHRGEIYAPTVRFDKRQYRKIKRLYHELVILIEDQDYEAPHSEEWEELAWMISCLNSSLYTIECRASDKANKWSHKKGGHDVFVKAEMSRIYGTILRGRRAAGYEE